VIFHYFDLHIQTYEDARNIEYREKYFDMEIILYDVLRLHYTIILYDMRNVMFFFCC